MWISYRASLCFGEQAFSVAGARQWNNLPVELRSVADTIVFQLLCLNVSLKRIFSVLHLLFDIYHVHLHR